MKAKKLLATLLTGCMVAGLMIGCGQKPAKNAAPAAEATSEAAAPAKEAPAEEAAPALSGEVHYAYWQDALGGYLEECKTNFETANPGVTVVLEPTAWGEYWTKLETAATGGQAADVFQLNGPNINKYAFAGVAANLDSYVANSSVDMANYPQALVDLYTVDGSVYGIPMDYDTIGLWYNKELFDAAGIAYPDENWTWEDLTAAAEALTDPANGVFGIAAGYADQGGFYNTVPALGGYIISDDHTKSGFSEQATIDGIKCWVDLMEKGYSPSQTSIDENPDYMQFMSGKIGMMFAGDWFAATFVTDEAFAAKCDCTYLPLMNGNRKTVIHGKANCVNAFSGNLDAAWAWVEYLAGDEANEILGKTGAAIPSHTAYSALFFEQYPQFNMNIFLEEAKNCAATYPSSKTSAEWGDIIWNELVPVFKLEVPVEDACANIATQMDALLATE